MTAKEYFVKRLVSRLYAGGTANRVVATSDGSTMALQQIVNAMVSAGGSGLGIDVSKTAIHAVGTRKTGAQAITPYGTGGFQAVLWDYGNTTDIRPSGVGVIHETVTNPSRFTWGAAGLVVVVAVVAWKGDINYSGAGYSASLILTKNGSTSGCTTISPLASRQDTAIAYDIDGAGPYVSHTVGQTFMFGVASVANGDYLEIKAAHFGGANTDIGDYGNFTSQVMMFLAGGS